MFSDGVVMLVDFARKLLIFSWEIGEDRDGFLN